MQTNIFVQTMKTSIWAIRSTSKGRDAERWKGDLQKCDYPIQERVQIVKLPNPTYPLAVDLMAQIEISIVCSLHGEVGLHMIHCHISISVL